MSGPLVCQRCGCLAVAWRQTRAGRWYMGIRDLLSDGSSEARAYAAQAGKRPHNCSTHISHHSAEFLRSIGGGL